MYGFSHDATGPWVGKALGADDYFATPAEALEAGRASFYHAGQDNAEKPAVWVAKLEKLDVADFMVEGLGFYISDMGEKALVEFEAGGQLVADWLGQYSPADAYRPGANPGDNVMVAFTRAMDHNFVLMIEFLSSESHWPVPALTRVMKGDQGGYQKLEVQYNQSPRFPW